MKLFCNFKERRNEKTDMKMLSDLDYRQILKAEKKAVVEFTSPTCGHCKAMQPVLEQLEKQGDGAVSFYHVGITQAQNAVAEYDVRSVPTFFFLREGEIQDRLTGEVHRAILEQAINKL